MSTLFLREAVAGAEGEGAEVRRLFPIRGFMNFDPFVLWDNFNVPPSAGFPDHPHRGFEGITYIFEGSMQHRDNLGNASTVQPGGLQRFTAGRGIVHSEMPGAGGATRGIQMWVNLPRELKQVEPSYQQVDANEVPVQDIDGGTVRELAGEHSPLRLKTPVRYLDVRLNPGARLQESMPQDFRGFLYLVDGGIRANDHDMTAGNALFYDGETRIDVEAAVDSRFLLCFGRPHGGPIVQHGPYVD